MKMGNERRQRPLWKTVLIFALVLLVCTGLGFLVGLASAAASDTLAAEADSMRDAAQALMLWAAPAAYGVLWAAGGGICAVLFSRAKRRFAAWNGEDEEEIAGIEVLLSDYSMITNCMLILSMALFGLWFYGAMVPSREPGWTGIFVPAVFVVGQLVLTLMQRAAVEMEKRINPEKRGEVLDLRFQTTWEGSLDEAERQIACQAGYKAFKAVSGLCMGLWLLCIVGMSALSMGVVSVLLVTLIWLVAVVVYQTEAMRLEHSHKTPRGE